MVAFLLVALLLVVRGQGQDRAQMTKGEYTKATKTDCVR